MLNHYLENIDIVRMPKECAMHPDTVAYVSFTLDGAIELHYMRIEKKENKPYTLRYPDFNSARGPRSFFKPANDLIHEYFERIILPKYFAPPKRRGAAK